MFHYYYYLIYDFDLIIKKRARVFVTMIHPETKTASQIFYFAVSVRTALTRPSYIPLYLVPRNMLTEKGEYDRCYLKTKQLAMQSPGTPPSTPS
jgi:hypothetical protein